MTSASAVAQFMRVAPVWVGVGVMLAMTGCSSGRDVGGGLRSSPSSSTVAVSPSTGSPTTVQNLVIDPQSARFGQAFRLGRLTITVTDAGSVPGSNTGGSTRRRVIVETSNSSGASDRAPGLAIVCERPPDLAGGSLYADPVPAPHPYVAGRVEPAGARDLGSITAAVNPKCATPALQVSTGGATINGLPRPVLIALT